MTSTTDGTGQLKAGVLQQETYPNAQAFYEDMIRATSLAPPVNGATSGTRITKETKTIVVTSGQRVVTLPFAGEDCIINLVNAVDETPTLHITCVRGTRLVLSAAAPNDNFSISITRLGVF